MIRGIIFDLDNTLYDYTLYHNHSMAALDEYAASRLSIPKTEFQNAFKEGRRSVKKQLANTTAQHNRLLYFQKALEFLGINPIPYALDLSNMYWDTMLNTMKPYEKALECLQILKEADIKISVCTDLTVEIQYKKIHRLGIKPYIDAIVTSEEIGIEKPDPKMFLSCLEKMRLELSQVIYIGDDYNKDIAGCQNIGMNYLWFNPYKKKSSDRQIESYDELLSLLPSMIKK